MEQLKIKLNTPAAVGNNSVLDIDFEGSLRGKIIGFYQSTYKDSIKGDR